MRRDGITCNKGGSHVNNLLLWLEDPVNVHCSPAGHFMTIWPPQKLTYNFMYIQLSESRQYKTTPCCVICVQPQFTMHGLDQTMDYCNPNPNPNPNPSLCMTSFASYCCVRKWHAAFHCITVYKTTSTIHSWTALPCCLITNSVRACLLPLVLQNNAYSLLC